MSVHDPATTLLTHAGLAPPAPILGQPSPDAYAQAAPADLEPVAHLVTDDPILIEEFLAAIGTACGEPDPRPGDATDLPMRVGQWRIDLRKQAVRSTILGAVAATALISQGWTAIGVALATGVLPSVLEIERVSLSAGDKKLLIEVRLLPAARTGALTADELYDALPGPIRDQVNKYDFADFVERCQQADAARDHNGHIQFLEP